MANPICSIIVPCYNQGKFLNEALNSVFLQTLTNWECIIVNDGSTDETEEIVRFWLETDKRFTYLHQENKGLPAARNFGIRNANGEFILPLDADDRIGSEYIKLATAEFQKDDLLKIVYCKAEKFGDDSGLLDLKTFSLYELALNNMIFCTSMFKKGDWETVGGYDETLNKGWEDWEFWISLLKNGGTVLKIDYLGFFYRIKSSSLLKNMNPQEENEILKYFSVKHAQFYVEQFGSFPKLQKKNIDLTKEKEEIEMRAKSLRYCLQVILSKTMEIKKFTKNLKKRNDK